MTIPADASRVTAFRVRRHDILHADSRRTVYFVEEHIEGFQ